MKRENIYEAISKSGIRIVGEVMPGAYSVSLGVWVKAGPVFETDGERGISHFIEHMLFKGTKKRSAKQLAAEMDSVGGSINAFTGKENTCYYTRTLGEDLSLALDILLDMICDPLLAESDIENEKGVVCEEILMGEDDPEDVVHEMLCTSIYEGYPLGYPILGSIESVRAITRDDIINYMDRRYQPQNIVIACAGAFDMDELVRLVDEKYISRERTAKDINCGGSIFVPGKRAVVAQKDVEQAHVCLAFPSEKFCGKYAMATSIINSVFGGATSSRLFQHIREQKGLAYSVYSIASAYSDTGYWTLYAGTAENKAHEVLECMIEELEILKRDGLTEQEFTRSKEQLRRGYILGLENVATHSQTLGKDMLYLGRTRDDDEILKRLADVTMQDISETIDMMVGDTMRLAVVSRNADDSFERTIKGRNI